MLTCNGVSKSRQGRCILQEVSIEVSPGSITTLTGASGAGKSTLLRILALIDLPDKGIVQVDGSTYTPIKRALRSTIPWPRVCMVFQEILLWPHLTGAQNVLAPLEKLKLQSDAERIAKLMELLNVDHVGKRYPVQMSRGEQQRIAIVRALAVRPTYLLLDEVTASLDREHLLVVARLLRCVAAEGMGILAVTHQPEFSSEIGARLVRLSDGAVSDA